MKVKILPENLTATVIEAGRVIPSRSTLPQANCVLLETYEGRLRVTGTDLETAISVYSGAQVEEEGKALVPARMLGHMLNTFDNSNAISLELDGKHGLTLATDGRTFKVVGMDPADYPPVPDTPTEAFTVNAQELRRALTRILDAAATDTTRPVLQAINFREQEGRLVLAAADGFRLAVHELDCSGAVPEINVPAKTLRELLRLLPKPKDDPPRGPYGEKVHVYVKPTDTGPAHVRFAFTQYDVVAMLVQGTFPNYTQLIPTTFEASVMVDTKALRRELAAASVLAAQGSGIVRFQIGPGDKLTLFARAEEEGEFEATLPANTSGGGAKIAFNCRWVDDFLKTVGTDTVELRVTTPSAPGLWRPVGEDGYSQTIMPMFVQW